MSAAPTWTTTGTLLRAAPMAPSATDFLSSTVSMGPSPVLPQGKTPSTPFDTWNCTSFASRSASTLPASSKGVRSAVKSPLTLEADLANQPRAFQVRLILGVPSGRERRREAARCRARPATQEVQTNSADVENPITPPGKTRVRRSLKTGPIHTQPFQPPAPSAGGT